MTQLAPRSGRGCAERASLPSVIRQAGPSLHAGSLSPRALQRLVQNKPAYYMAQERLRCPHMSGCEGDGGGACAWPSLLTDDCPCTLHACYEPAAATGGLPQARR